MVAIEIRTNWYNGKIIIIRKNNRINVFSIISFILLSNSSFIPFLAAFFIDLISVSKVLDVTSIKNFINSENKRIEIVEN